MDPYLRKKLLAPKTVSVGLCVAVNQNGAVALACALRWWACGRRFDSCGGCDETGGYGMRWRRHIACPISLSLSLSLFLSLSLSLSLSLRYVLSICATLNVYVLAQSFHGQRGVGLRAKQVTSHGVSWQ